MASSILNAKLTGLVAELPALAIDRIRRYRAVYDDNRHRIYNLAFYATDNEMTAEAVSARVFTRAFRHSCEPTSEALDNALITELRDMMPIGVLTLNDTKTCTEAGSVRANVKRVVLERAVVQLPATERLIFMMHDVEGYDHERIAHTLGLTEEESVFGLHQARLRIRKLVPTIAA